MNSIKVLIYTQRIGVLIAIIILCSLIWIRTTKRSDQEILRSVIAKITSIMLVVLSILIIYYFTLSGRGKPLTGDTLRLFPFYPIVFHEMYDEYFRTLFMNVLLFYPFGVGVSFSLPKKMKYRSMLVTLLGFLLSLYVEFLQYRYHLGIFETDDLICNTFGAFLGSILYVIYRKMGKSR